MKARKWLSNSSEVITVIPQELRTFEIDRNHNTLPSTKTLVVLWTTEEHAFSFCITTPLVADVLTKRFIVERVAEVLNPMGLASPFIVRARSLFKSCA